MAHVELGMGMLAAGEVTLGLAVSYDSSWRGFSISLRGLTLTIIQVQKEASVDMVLHATRAVKFFTDPVLLPRRRHLRLLCNQ